MITIWKFTDCTKHYIKLHSIHCTALPEIMSINWKLTDCIVHSADCIALHSTYCIIALYVIEIYCTAGPTEMGINWKLTDC